MHRYLLLRTLKRIFYNKTAYLSYRIASVNDV